MPFLRHKKILLGITTIVVNVLAWILIANTLTTSKWPHRNLDTSKMFPGCVLIFPHNPVVREELVPLKRPRVFLVNKSTLKVVRSWETDYPVASAKLQNDGSIWILTKFLWSEDSDIEIHQIDKDSQVVQSIKMPGLRMDLDVHKNSVFTVQYENLPHPLLGNETGKWDRVIEYDVVSKKIIWSFETKNYPEWFKEINRVQLGSRDLTHVNSVRYVATNPINHRPAVLVSIRNISKVVLIDYETKDILWQSDKVPLEFQHDPRLLENGNLLVFNNRRFSTSSVVEQIDILTHQTVWRFFSKTQNDFHTTILGGAQRLANGNTLITNGMAGQIFEITPDGTLVWEYWQEFEKLGSKNVWPLSPIFRVEQYDSSNYGNAEILKDCGA